MRAAGIVVEYNPFHNGHLFHLNETKKVTNADLVIAVMSGPFLQRGEPALISKWERTQMALSQGIDIVAELPYAYAVQQADLFSFGAVSILDALGCTDLCFGSEQGNIDPFLQTIQFLNTENTRYQHKINQFIKTGVSFPKAQALAFKSLDVPPEAAADLSQPNNILGYHYIKAIQEINSGMRPSTIKRKQANYHDEDFNFSPIASATSIRNNIFTEGNCLSLIQNKVPAPTFEILAKESSPSFMNWERAFPFLSYRIRTASLQELNEIYEMEEGLEYRLKRYISQASSFKDFMTAIKTKRYTWTRLQRLCTHILTNTQKKDMVSVMNHTAAPYVRLLGMNELGRDYLNKIKKTLAVPLITKVKKEKPPLLNLDLKAAKLYDFLFYSTDHHYLEEEQRSPLLFQSK